MTDQHYTIKVDNLSKTFGQTKAVQNVSFNVQKGRITGLLGPNGAGKTTTIRMINYIIPVDEGSILINDQKVSADTQRLIGYMPEERGLYKKMKVGEQLLYLAQLKGLSKEEATARIKEWVARFEIKEWMNKHIEDLSKGMQQKVQFMATVLHEPSLVILDEPFSG